MGGGGVSDERLEVRRGLPLITSSYFKWLSALATLLLVFYAGTHWLIGPHLNPNPTKRVAFGGAFPYAQGWDLRLRQEFYTTGAICQMTARIFFLIPVAEVARERQVSVPVKRIDNSRYEAEYFEDYYEPGLCGWESGFVYADAIRGKENMYGGALLGFPRKYNKIDYHCSDVVSNLATGREVQKSCYEHDRRSFDAARAIGEINFHLKGEGQ